MVLSDAAAIREPLLVIMLVVAFAGLTRPRARTLTRVASFFLGSPPAPRSIELPCSEHPAESEVAAQKSMPWPAPKAKRTDRRVEDSTWTDLMAQVSHELRTPLNAVIGFSDVMETELLGPVGHPRYREYARHIRDCGRELLKSAEDTLAITSLLARPGTQGAPSTFELASLASEAWSFFAARCEAQGIGLEIRAPQTLEILGERRPLRQILINLFAEAIDRTPGGGNIILVASVEGDLVHLEISVPRAIGQDCGPAKSASLALCMARTLLELQGSTLLEIADETCAWRAAMVLGCAAQSDFFDLVDRAELIPAYPC
jgi:hypothetical protein